VITVDGARMRDQIARLKKLPAQMRKEIRAALGKTARAVAADVRAGYRGLHAGSTRTKYWAKTPAYGQIRNTLAKRGGLSARVFATRDAFYTRFVELGTKSRTTRRGFRRGSVTANPIFETALARHTPAMADDIAAAIQKAWDDGTLK
jgi:hypothetical protein